MNGDGQAPRFLYPLLALMLLFWALNFIAGKIVLREFPALLAGGLRTTFAALLILPAYVIQMLRKPAQRWSREDLAFLTALGIVGIALNQVAFLVGLDRTTVAHASLIFGLSPIWVLLVAAAIGQERITRGRLAGLLIALAGVVVLQGKQDASGGGATLAGDALVLVGAFCFALFTVFGKQATVRHGGITVNTFGYLGGALVLSPVILWQSRAFAYSEVSRTGWAALLYMALFPSIFSNLIYYYALNYRDASRVAALVYLNPLLATLLAVVILGEPVTRPVVAGGGLVLAGVYVAERG